MISAIISRLVILLFGTLYPAYASYKAVRTKNVKEYVKWMMYWIVFALFTCAETFTDVFLSFWFPFYYEIKIVIVVWLLSPATKGSSILYRNFVHPALTRREQEIDEYISKAKEQGYHTMLHLGSKGVTYATNVIMQTAIKGGGGIVNHLRRSYSLSDLADETDLKADLNRNSKLQDTVDSSDVPRDPRLRTPRKPLGSHIDLYFPEMDVEIRSHHELPVSLSQIRSNEDISSGYSSAEPLYGGEMAGTETTGNPLVRTASVGATRTRPRATRANVTAQPKKPLTTEEFEADFGAEFGWQHSFPPIPIASIFPELCNIDSTRFPPNAFLSPEVLQYIYAGSLYSSEPCNISELNDERETKGKAEIPKEKLFVDAEQNDSFMKASVKDPDNIATENKQTNSMNPINFNEKKSKITELETNVNLRTEENSTIDSNESESPTIIDSSTNLNSDYAVTEVFKKVVVLTEELIDSNPPIKEINDVEPKEVETNEYFEDASDVEVQGIMALNVQIRMSPSESHLAETQSGNMKPTTSLESVASSDDQGFEDSVPDVAMVSGWESPSNGDRRGKYNKARAPPPPDAKPCEEPEFVEKSQSQFSSCESPVQPSPSQSSTTALESVERTSLSSDANNYNSQDNENLSQSDFSYRDVSPTPSQSKKDSSHFSRFLPKTGMTSLFGLWGPKDEGRSTGGRKSPSSGICYSSTGSTETSGYRISTPLRSDESARSTSKLLIRQMSHSPSRKRHH